MCEQLPPLVVTLRYGPLAVCSFLVSFAFMMLFVNGISRRKEGPTFGMKALIA